MLTDILYTLGAVAVALLLRTFVLSFARIRGTSMMPTLKNGNWTFVWRLHYRLHPPRRGDVVICCFPGRRVKRLPFLRQNFVKRVVGLPGDTLEVVEGVLHVNGQPLEEPYLDPARKRFFRSPAAITLGADEYYVLGDNRDGSSDSRRVGPLHRRDILGQVVFAIWPPRRLR